MCDAMRFGSTSTSSSSTRARARGNRLDDDDARASSSTVGNFETRDGCDDGVCERRCGSRATRIDAVIIRARARAMCDD